jgi:hypothetical protein
MSGFSVFYKNAAGDVFHTYSTYGRGSEEIVSTYVCLDLTPKGRNETGPYFNLGDWYDTMIGTRTQMSDFRGAVPSTNSANCPPSMPRRNVVGSGK